jgi:hypothetical protein
MMKNSHTHDTKFPRLGSKIPGLMIKNSGTSDEKFPHLG